MSRPTIKARDRNTKGNRRSTGLAAAPAAAGAAVGSVLSGGIILSDFDLHLAAFDLRAVQFRDDAAHMFGGHIDEQMPLANIDRPDNFSRKTGFAENRAEHIPGADTHVLA